MTNNSPGRRTMNKPRELPGDDDSTARVRTSDQVRGSQVTHTRTQHSNGRRGRRGFAEHQGVTHPGYPGCQAQAVRCAAFAKSHVSHPKGARVREACVCKKCINLPGDSCPVQPVSARREARAETRFQGLVLGPRPPLSGAALAEVSRRSRGTWQLNCPLLRVTALNLACACENRSGRA